MDNKSILSSERVTARVLLESLTVSLKGLAAKMK
jgi:hypothetical protein